MFLKKRRQFIIYCGSFLTIYPLMSLNLINSINFNKNLLTSFLSKSYQNLNPKLDLKKEINDLNFLNIFYDKKNFLFYLKKRILNDYKNGRVHFYNNTYYSLTEMKISYIIHNI